MTDIPVQECPRCTISHPATLFEPDDPVCPYCKVEVAEILADRLGSAHERKGKRSKTVAQMAEQLKNFTPDPEQPPPPPPPPPPKVDKPKAKDLGPRAEAEDPKAIAKRVLLQRELMRRRLLPFVEHSKPKYLAGWVHKEICAKLEQFAQDVVDGKSPRLMLFLPPRHGKLIENKALVLTQNRGWTTHGDLRPGDYVFHPSGKAVKVLAVSAEDMAECVVETSDGAKIKCHENHEWTIHDRTTKTTRTVETKWLMATTKFGKQRKLGSGPPGKRGHRYKFQIDRIAALEFPEADLSLPPYFLGAWLGDGHTERPYLCASAKDTQTLARCAELVGQPSSVRVHKDTGVIYHYFSGLSKAMRSLGLLGHKHIPAVYQQSSIAQRMQLLAGLIDTDGSVEPGTGRVRIVTALPGLRDDVVQLLRGLGFVPRVSEAEACVSTSGVIGRNKCYTVSFYPDKPIPTALPRKQIKHMRPNERIAITAVYKTTDTAPGKCIQVDSPDGLYLVGRELTPTHNSQIASIDFPAWFLGHHPDMEVIACSYSASLAEKFSRKVRALVRTPEFQGAFPDCVLDPEAQAAEGWQLLAGGGYAPAGVNGPITGKGAHVLIIDDPVKNREEAESANQQEAVIDWYTSTAYTRLAPGGGVLVIMTRWHDADLAGKLLQAQTEGGDQWEVISYPAIAVDDEKYRRAGDALHPERYPVEALARIKNALLASTGVRDWEALYQQNPVSNEGDYFAKKDFKYYKPEEIADKRLRYYAAFDFAIGKKEQNDYTVGIVVGVDTADNIYIVDLIRGRWSSEDLIEQILDLYVKWKPSIVGLERGVIEMSIGPFLSKRIEERKLWEMYIEELKPGRRDKVARARAIQGRIQQGKVFFPAGGHFVPTLMAEMLRFPSGEHDDQVDALAWIGHMMVEFHGIKDKQEEKKKSWRDKVEKLAREAARKKKPPKDGDNSGKRRSAMAA